jgi:hypothetical protein
MRKAWKDVPLPWSVTDICPLSVLFAATGYLLTCTLLTRAKFGGVFRNLIAHFLLVSFQNREDSLQMQTLQKQQISINLMGHDHVRRRWQNNIKTQLSKKKKQCECEMYPSAHSNHVLSKRTLLSTNVAT